MIDENKTQIDKISIKFRPFVDVHTTNLHCKQIFLSKFESLTMIEMEDCYTRADLKTVIQFLDTELMLSGKCFVKTRFTCHDRINKDLGDFEQLCNKTHNLLIKQKVPIDILIKFHEFVLETEDKELEHFDIDIIFSIRFNQTEILNTYVKPKCNLNCKPLEKPTWLLAFCDSAALFRVQNAVQHLFA